ncbi:MAG TPA: hypothetical protein PKH79_03690 [Prolixibacteraceae bacterium]|nr:hypothetical protein [Prolixibacteraceae bacterium]
MNKKENYKQLQKSPSGKRSTALANLVVFAAVAIILRVKVT